MDTRAIVGTRMMNSPEIKFPAIVYKVQTLATDLGVRVTLDLPETCIMQMAQLAECKRAGVYLNIVATPDKQEYIRNDEQTNSVETRTKRKSEWKTAEPAGAN